MHVICKRLHADMQGGVCICIKCMSLLGGGAYFIYCLSVSIGVDVY